MAYRENLTPRGDESEMTSAHLRGEDEWLSQVEGALQLLTNSYGWIHFTQVPERVSTKSFVVLIIGNSKWNHLGAQGTLNPEMGAISIFPSIYIHLSIYIYLS